MNSPVSERDSSPDIELEVMLRELAKAQLDLGTSVSSTSQFLQFILTLTNENLSVIRSQLETIQNLANEINDWDQASPAS